MVRILACVAALVGAGNLALAQDFRWPVSGTVTQTFFGTFSGKYDGPYYDEAGTLKDFNYTGGDGMHRGIDIAAPTGTPMVASRGGTAITYADNGGGYGAHVVIDHGSGYFTLYGHMSSIGVPNGKTLATGDFIGEIGCTGNCTGPHVHFEIRYSAAGGAWSYNHPRYYIPSTDGSAVPSGGGINYDYPNIGASSPTPTPTPTPTVTPYPGGYINEYGVFVGTPDNSGDGSGGEGEEGGDCHGSVGLPDRRALLLWLPLALALVALRRRVSRP